MTGQTMTDQVLRAFLASGSERAPEDAVLEVIEQVETTAQRRSPLFAGRDGRRSPILTISVIAAVVVLTVIIGIGIGVQVGLIRLPPAPTPAPSVPSAAMQTVSPADSGISFGYPEGWALTVERPFETWQYEGSSPDGRMSISFGTPISLGFCPVECTDLGFDMPIPYTSERAAELIAAEVSTVTGVTEWEPLPGPGVAGLEAGRVQEVTTTDPVLGERRDFILVGVFEGRAVAFTWSQPVDAFDANLMNAVMVAVFLDPAGPQYASGALATYTDQALGFAVAIPDIWYESVQPSIDGQPASGVRRFGERELTISLGDPDGAVRLCAASCTEVMAATSLDALETAVTTWMPASAGGTTETRGETTIDGAPARFIQREVADDSGSRTSYAAYGVVSGSPIVLFFDVPSGVVTLGGIEEIVASFTYLEAPPRGGEAFTAPDGSFTIDLSEGMWRPASGPDPSALYLKRQSAGVGLGVDVALRWGDATGRIQTCDEPAGPWEVCDLATATSLDELEAAVAIEPVDDHGVGPPVPTTDDILLDGEPARLIEIQAYEYPARGGQVVAYVIAMHDGRPFIIRFWTSANQLGGVSDMLDDFRFED